MQVRYTHRTISELVRGIDGTWLFQDSISPPLPESEYQRFLGIPGYVKYESPAIPEPVSDLVPDAIVTITETPATEQPIQAPRKRTRRK